MTMPVPKETTLTVLGCGTLGKAILRGIMTSQATNPSDQAPGAPNRFIACVTRTESADSIAETLSPITSNLTILRRDNVRGAQQADIVLLACKPQQVEPILQEEGMKKALSGKLLLSILAGVPSRQIEAVLGQYGDSNSQGPESNIAPCRVVRIMPNTASGIGESMTVVEKPDPPVLSEEARMLVHWMFSRIGKVVELPPHLFDASTAVCGSGPAFFSLMVEAMADGGVAMGIPRREAQVMAAQTMKGTAEMVLKGEHPALLRDKVSTPGGCTIGGLLVMEEGRVRGNIARAVREATVVAGELGKGTQGVNGTRF